MVGGAGSSQEADGTVLPPIATHNVFFIVSSEASAMVSARNSPIKAHRLWHPVGLGRPILGALGLSSMGVQCGES